MQGHYIAAAVAAFALLGESARADIVINFVQVGNDVFATGSGSVNLTGLNFLLAPTALKSAWMRVPATTVAERPAGLGNFRAHHHSTDRLR
jgi:hypothetical protein